MSTTTTYPPLVDKERCVQMPATSRSLKRPEHDHFWCDHCGTNHRNRLIAAECVRLLVNGPDQRT